MRLENLSISQGKRQSTDTNRKILELADFKAAIIIMLQEIKANALEVNAKIDSRDKEIDEEKEVGGEGEEEEPNEKNLN